MTDSPPSNGGAAGNGQSPAPTEFSDAFHTEAATLVKRYPVARSALLPLLHLVQAEHGWVTPVGIAFCAEALSLTKAEVATVATFYTMFKRAPTGDYLVSVCTNPTCQIAGSQVIYDRYHEALGDSTHDLETGVSIEEAECLGICDAAPVVQVNYEMFGPVTDAEADRVLEGCRNGEPPVSNWSGERPPTFREVERELSGVDDAFGDALIDAARHAVTDYDNVPAYKTGQSDTVIPVTHPGGDPSGHGGAVFRAEFEGRTVDADRARDDIDHEVAAAVTAAELAAARDQTDAEADDEVAGDVYGDGGPAGDYAPGPAPTPDNAAPLGVVHGQVPGAPGIDQPGHSDATVEVDSQLVEEVGEDRSDAKIVAPDHVGDDNDDTGGVDGSAIEDDAADDEEA